MRSSDMPDTDYQLFDNHPLAPGNANDFYDLLNVDDARTPEEEAKENGLSVDPVIDINDHPAPPEEKRIIYVKQKTLARIRAVSKCLALFTAFYDASGIIMSLNDMEEMSDDTLTKMLGLSINHLFYAVPIFYAIPSFDINYPSIVDGYKMGISFYYSDLPLQFKSPCCGYDGLNCCNRFRSIIACSAILLIACFASAADGLDGDYFVLQVITNPALLWQIFSVICSVPVALTTLLTETPELFSYFCSNMDEALLPVLAEGEVYVPPVAEERIQLRPCIQELDTLIGNYLRIFGGIELAIEVYVALVALINPVSATAKYLLFSVSFLRSSTNFFFYGKKGLDTVDALFLNLAGGGPNLKQLIVFLLSIVPVSLVTDCLRELYRKFLTDPSTELPFYLPSVLVELIAVHTAIFEGVVLLGATTDLLTRSINYLQHQLYSLYEKCCGGHAPLEEEEIHAEAEAKVADQAAPDHEEEFKTAPPRTNSKKKPSSAKKDVIIEMGSSSKRKYRAHQEEHIVQPLMANQPVDIEPLDEDGVDPGRYVPPVYRQADNRNAFFNAPPTPIIQPDNAPLPAQKKSYCVIM